MKRLKFMMPFAMLVALSSANAQTTTQVFKPGPSVGEDAYLSQFDGNCIPSGLSQTPADIPHGNTADLLISAWTWNAIGCNTGTQRTLIRFVQLNTIPPSANIVSATLRLRTPPTMPGYSNWQGNSYYPGSPFPNPNPGTLYRVSPGAAYNWDEMTVTWNQFVPLSNNTVPGSAVAIPASTSQFGTLDIDVTNAVQNIVTGLGSNPYANNGFYLKLNTEVRYTNCDPSFIRYFVV